MVGVRSIISLKEIAMIIEVGRVSAETKGIPGGSSEGGLKKP